MGAGVSPIVDTTGPPPVLRAAAPPGVGPSDEEPSDLILFGVYGADSPLPIRSRVREHSEPWAGAGVLWIVGVYPTWGRAGIAESEEASGGGDPSEGSQSFVRSPDMPLSAGICCLAACPVRKRVGRVIVGSMEVGA